ncbi:hypothetical protein J3R30DRAFT_127603 [Lentinula aciculospora]|uniref:Uncharacterized protein n=1 Tax=Lentinula aciculospora TaxID=153920 RepID=A0A9W9AUA3_9AGAR|nr:hypothetical protein J3R30DRAFT_127603 [Lentinula aciculospora]
MAIHLAKMTPPAFRATFPGVVYQVGNMVFSAIAQIEQVETHLKPRFPSLSAAPILQDRKLFPIMRESFFQFHNRTFPTISSRALSPSRRLVSSATAFFFAFTIISSGTSSLIITLSSAPPSSNAAQCFSNSYP